MKKILLIIAMLFVANITKAETTAQMPDGWTNGSGGEISNLAELRWLSETTAAWDEDWVLTADINATETSTWNAGSGFSPIGTMATYFTGTFDGKGYEISNLYINRPGEDFVGFFGISENSTISNFKIDAEVTGNDYVGVLTGASGTCSIVDCDVIGTVQGNDNVGCFAGESFACIIDDCDVTGTVQGNNYVGGFTGISSDSLKYCTSSVEVTGHYSVGGLVGGYLSADIFENTVLYCYATGTVTATGTGGNIHVGGLVGEHTAGSIINSFCTGAVTGGGVAGGFVGKETNNGYILNCYCTGSVEANNDVGGFAGNISRGHIINCYSTGAVTGAVSVAGFTYNFDGEVSNCYWDTETSGIDYEDYDEDDPAKGKTTEDMKDQESYTDWDFENTWSIDTYKNNGYPFLQWQTEFVPVILNTDLVTTITLATGISGGSNIENNGNAITAKGLVWSTAPEPKLLENEAGNTNMGFGLGSFTSQMTELTANTTYYVRAYAANTIGTGYGSEVSFTTLASVATSPVETFSASSAKAGGMIPDQGNGTISARGVVMSPTDNTPEIDEDGVSKYSAGSGTGEFSTQIEYLAPNTTYYARAYATNESGTSYGETVSFTTEQDINLTTKSATEITGNSAMSGGSEEGTVTESGICWNTTGNPNIDDDSKTETGETGGNFNSEITGLALNTTYYIRAYQINDSGVIYGDEKTFTTLAEGVNIRNTDTDGDGKDNMNFLGTATPDGEKSILSMGFQIATNYEMTENMQYLADPNAESRGYILVNWDDYTYGEHAFSRWYILYTDGSEDFGPVSAFEKNEGTGVIQIGG